MELKTESFGMCQTSGDFSSLFQITGLKSCLFSDSPLNLPLVPGGYIATKEPLYRPLSPHLKAKSVAVSAEHVLLLSATGAVYTWGLGR